MYPTIIYFLVQAKQRSNYEKRRFLVYIYFWCMYFISHHFQIIKIRRYTLITLGSVQIPIRYCILKTIVQEPYNANFFRADCGCCFQLDADTEMKNVQGPVRFFIQNIWAEILFIESNLGKIVSSFYFEDLSIELFKVKFIKLSLSVNVLCYMSI